MWRWPLAAPTSHPVPGPGHPGSFGAIRKHDRHTGVDLYCEVGAEVGVVDLFDPAEGAAVEVPGDLGLGGEGEQEGSEEGKTHFLIIFPAVEIS